MINPLRLISRKWLLTTLLVIVGTAVMIRLGIWQLDRLEQRRNFNQRVLEQINQPSLDLSLQALIVGDVTVQALSSMEYRKITVTGIYDFNYEVALRNQVWHDQYGVHLLTPLKIQGSEYVIFVDRGWIPGDEFDNGLKNGSWPIYQETGTVFVEGILRNQQIKPDFGRISDPTPMPGGEKLLAWNLVNLEQIQKQMPYPILPVYIQQAPNDVWSRLPYRSEPDLELTEGSHLGYAIQWFTFAGILFFGYPVFIQREERRPVKQDMQPS